MAVYLEDFFFRLRRRKGESAGSWSIRSYECYQKLRRALARVQGVMEPEVTKKKYKGRSWSWGKWSTPSWGAAPWSGEPWDRQTTPSTAEPGENDENANADEQAPEAEAWNGTALQDLCHGRGCPCPSRSLPATRTPPKARLLVARLLVARPGGVGARLGGVCPCGARRLRCGIMSHSVHLARPGGVVVQLDTLLRRVRRLSACGCGALAGCVGGAQLKTPLRCVARPSGVRARPNGVGNQLARPSGVGSHLQ